MVEEGEEEGACVVARLAELLAEVARKVDISAAAVEAVTAVALVLG